MKILTVISARGGSKRIPNKNIKEFVGKPLIAWTIEAALKSEISKKIIVSTDDQKIADISKEYGAEVPFLRPPHLAKDETPGIDPVLHVISEISGYDWVLLLQPTSPLRNHKDIKNIVKFSKDNNFSSVVSVSKVSIKPHNLYKIKDHYLVSQSIKKAKKLDDDIFIINGAMYLSKSELVIEKKSFVTNQTIGYVMPEERSIDIDTIYDWKIASYLKKNVTEK